MHYKGMLDVQSGRKIQMITIKESDIIEFEMNWT